MKNSFQDILSEHKLECVCGAIAAVVLLTNLGSIKGFVAENNQLRDSMKAEQANNQRLQVEQLVDEQRKEVADDRYRSNCVMIFSLNRQGFYSALSEGEPIIKGELAAQYRGKKINLNTMPNSAFLPAGMTVCDPLGNTGKLVKDSSLKGIAVVADIATTGDQTLIRAAIERDKGIFVNPVK